MHGVTSSAEDTVLKKCRMHSCHVSEQLQTPVMGLNLSFYITASFLCTELVSCRESGGAKVEYFCLISTTVEPLAKVNFSNMQRPRNATPAHRSISKEVLGNYFSTESLSVEVRSAVPKGIVVGCCCWRSFSWEITLLCWLSTDFGADEVKCLSAGERGTPFVTSVF